MYLALYKELSWSIRSFFVAKIVSIIFEEYDGYVQIWKAVSVAILQPTQGQCSYKSGRNNVRRDSEGSSSMKFLIMNDLSLHEAKDVTTEEVFIKKRFQMANQFIDLLIVSTLSSSFLFKSRKLPKACAAKSCLRNPLIETSIGILLKQNERSDEGTLLSSKDRGGVLQPSLANLSAISL